jgi:predicted ATPase
MIKRIRLKKFKNFEDVELILGPLTVLIGSNAAGKSNVQDAFRFLKGIGQRYTLAEIIGERYEGGLRQWPGIRGGVREIAFSQQKNFEISIEFDADGRRLKYLIGVEAGYGNGRPTILQESLMVEGVIYFEFYANKRHGSIIRFKNDSKAKETLLNKQQPILTQILEGQARLGIEQNEELQSSARETTSILNSMRFIDLDPRAMRRPSFPGQTVLGDQGENLSSVLQAIWEEPQQKETFIEWVRELAPMDASDFEFFEDQSGRISLTLVEKNGQRTSIHSASDGTLRFLGMVAALFSPHREQLYVFDEIDTGIHPARLYLLLQLLEWRAFQGGVQILGMTHSPQVLRLLSEEALEYVSLIYRLTDVPQAKIQRIMSIPDIHRILETQDVARLHESGWFEDVMYFDAGSPE